MDATSEGERLIKAWLGAEERLRRAKSDVNSAECELNNTQRALAKWIFPEDSKPGEKIAIWYGDSLIQAEVPLQEHMTPEVKVRIRKRGRQLHAA